MHCAATSVANSLTGQSLCHAVMVSAHWYVQDFGVQDEDSMCDLIDYMNSVYASTCDKSPTVRCVESLHRNRR